MRTPYERACRNALDVQDACNLVAVVNHLQRDLQTLRDQPDHSGTDWIRAHPVVVLYVDKLFDMVHRPEFDDYRRAYDACKAVVELAENRDPSEAEAS